MKIIAKPIKTMVVFDFPPEPEELISNPHASAKAPIPYKFKIRENDDEIIVVVGSILSRTKEKKAGIEAWIYQCQSIIDGIEKRYELKYIISRCEWQLYKI